METLFDSLSTENNLEIILPPGKLRYFPNWCSCSFDEVDSEIEWESEQLTIFGKQVEVPRLVAYFGDKPYTYSGLKHPAKTFPPILEKLRRQLSDSFKFDFNAVLCNLYRNGTDYMGYHSDNEKEIDDSLIASISLGQSRMFKVKNASTTHSILLENRSLLLMENLQKDYKHSLPKTAKPMHARINLTFRKMY